MAASFCTDIGGIKFSIIYAGNSKYKQTYWIPSDCFQDIFKAIMVFYQNMNMHQQYFKYLMIMTGGMF